jgi:CDP-6-deoxy-D-xylo-4-hexulose-3-dehydrase
LELGRIAVIPKTDYYLAMFWRLQENILEEKDTDMLVDFIKTTTRFTQFVKVREFEEAWSRWQGCKYSVYVNSGSSANLIMLSLMKQRDGWRDGDEVIVPAVTWVTNISPVFQCGLKPVFMDINLEDFSFNYDQLAAKITEKTRAIFVTHLIGFPADIHRIEKIIGDRKIEILEDCCESHGAMVRDKKIGNLGICSSFSFYWGHHMTTVEGGMVCTNDEEIYKMALLKRSHGLARELPPQHHQEYKDKHPNIDFNFLFLTDGFNFRNTELHAVLGLSQIQHLDRYIRIRNENYKKFLEILQLYKDFLMLPYKEGMSSFSLPLIFRNIEDKEAFQGIIHQAGIESRPVISGNLMRQPFLKQYIDGSEFTNAEFLHTNAFYIGNNQFVNDERLSKLSFLLKDFFGNRR